METKFGPDLAFSSMTLLFADLTIRVRYCITVHRMENKLFYFIFIYLFINYAEKGFLPVRIEFIFVKTFCGLILILFRAARTAAKRVSNLTIEKAASEFCRRYEQLPDEEAPTFLAQLAANYR